MNILARPSCSTFPRLAAFRSRPITRIKRALHRVRPLEYDIDKGLGDFLSPEALKMIAVEYQGGLLERLNHEVKGTPMEVQSVLQTVISTAQNKNQILAFNYASQALNNSFFLDNLKPPPTPDPSNPIPFDPSHEMYIPGQLLQRIRLSFGDISQFKSHVSAAALGMMGSGWVWVVANQRGELAVIATYGPGTMLVRSRRHEGPWKMPIVGEELMPSTLASAPPKQPPLSSPSKPRPPFNPRMQTRSFLFSSDPQHSLGLKEPKFSSQQDMNKIDEHLAPLFCISVHEHAWLGGYGIWGKEEYLKRFWTVLDWRKVGQTLAKFVPDYSH